GGVIESNTIEGTIDEAAHFRAACIDEPSRCSERIIRHHVMVSDQTLQVRVVNRQTVRVIAQTQQPRKRLKQSGLLRAPARH
ncbi:MAG: hypothetical protein ACI91Q_002813, partial [Gammaproteobacteria bacterium]